MTLFMVTTPRKAFTERTTSALVSNFVVTFVPRSTAKVMKRLSPAFKVLSSDSPV